MQDHSGRGEYETLEAVTHQREQLSRVVEQIRQVRDREDVYIPSDAIYEACGWHFGGNGGYAKLLPDCAKWELDEVCLALFTRCKVLQAKVDALTQELATRDSALSLMR